MMNLGDFTQSFTDLLSRNPEQAEIYTAGSELLAKLVSAQGWFNETLSRLVLDKEFLQVQPLSMDANEILLYRSPQRLFSIRAYIWETGLKYPVHDHGAWGLVGVHINQIRERKFDLLVRDGHHAEVQISADHVCTPGEVTVVLPLDKGIHQMEALDKTALTIHVYGPAIRKGYIQAYDLHFKQVTRMYAPQLQKKALAIRTLGFVPDQWAEELLKSALQSEERDYFRLECQDALKCREDFLNKS